jgi:hypothetical protein
MRCFALLLGLLVSRVGAEDDCSAPDPSLDDPTAMVVRWAFGADENQPPQLEIYLPDRDDLTIEVEYRLGIDGAAVTWSPEARTPDALEVLVDEPAVPADAYWEPDQAARLSSMTVEVSAWGGSALLFVASADPIRVAFPYGPDEPIFLDPTLVELLAPGGVMVDAKESAEGDWETIETVKRPAVDTDRTIELVDRAEEN